MGASKKYVVREQSAEGEMRLVEQGVDPLMARLYASRGIRHAHEIAPTLDQLLRPETLKGSAEAAVILGDAIQSGSRVCIVADYDCDGASACAVMVRGLQTLGAAQGSVSFVVPDRKIHGYGLTPTIVDLAIEQCAPQVLVTVDNGIASFAGVTYGRQKGLKVVVTDHHLPASKDGEIVLPDADAIVNPSQPGCEFGSKNACGATVAFYVLLQVRAELRRRGQFEATAVPRLDGLLDLVGLATVADVVKLDDNNRRLVAQGLKRIREGRSQAGVRALFGVAGKRYDQASSMDLGFTLGPRINAAGRLSDMTIGIECLLADEDERAEELAAMLHEINVQRRAVESSMDEQAKGLLERMSLEATRFSIVVHDDSFHEGVVGIVAGKLKERHHRPTFVFANTTENQVKGSGRSIPGFHLRDALDLVSKRHPDLIAKFGGHAMAAGCTLRAGGVDAFRQALDEVAQEWLTTEAMEQRVQTDGSLAAEDCCVDVAKRLDDAVWGQAFEAPLFLDKVKVVSQRVVGSKHMKLVLDVHGRRRDAIWFGRTEPLEESCELAYRIGVNAWQGRETVQLVVDGQAVAG